MPCLNIFTNIAKSQIPQNLVSKIIPVLVKGVKKPPEKFICVVNADCFLNMKEDSETPGIVATLESIGHLGPEENDIIVKELAKFFETELGVQPSRFFLTLYDLEKHNVAINASTIKA
ncbi:macrophage migration inhibitory factor [Danaus plexippus plexippus]|uniref:L-dopachrome isomerase n=1 Tax=Danaus plexippus plexippus TaxID=278856 RepID=A0A212EQM3_DANPL|nr:macrophage migration inhibitory factor [Danaus plexippus plexippus]